MKRGLACAVAGATLLLPAFAADQRIDALDRKITAGSGYRIVRFVAWAEGEIPPQEADGHFLPRGHVTPGRGSDPILGAAAADYSTVVTDVDGQKGQFTDTGVIRFAGGELRFAAGMSTHNAETPVPNLMQTVLIEKITGGSGEFDGAAGYFLMNVTLEPLSLPKPQPTKNYTYRGTVNGLIFVRNRTP